MLMRTFILFSVKLIVPESKRASEASSQDAKAARIIMRTAQCPGHSKCLNVRAVMIGSDKLPSGLHF